MSQNMGDSNWRKTTNRSQWGFCYAGSRIYAHRYTANQRCFAPLAMTCPGWTNITGLWSIPSAFYLYPVPPLAGYRAEVTRTISTTCPALREQKALNVIDNMRLRHSSIITTSFMICNLKNIFQLSILACTFLILSASTIAQDGTIYPLQAPAEPNAALKPWERDYRGNQKHSPHRQVFKNALKTNH